jgi:hypothetical protein
MTARKRGGEIACELLSSPLPKHVLSSCFHQFLSQQCCSQTCKVTILNFLSFSVKPIPTSASARRGIPADVALGRLASPVLFGLCVKDAGTSCRHVQLDTALVPMCSTPSLAVSYPEMYIDRAESWLRNQSTAIRSSKCTTRTATRIQQPMPVQFWGQQMQIWTSHLGATLDTRLTWTAHVK